MQQFVNFFEAFPKLMCSRMKTNQATTEPFFISCTCYICSETFDSAHDATKHVKKHFDDKTNRKQWRQCDFAGCTQKSRSGPMFMEHLSTHYSGLKLFHCRMCEYQSGVKRSALQHAKKKASDKNKHK